MGWLDLLAVQRTLKSLLQHHSSKASILRRSAFFLVQLSNPYMTTGKTIALTRWTFVGKVMSLLFNTLSSESESEAWTAAYQAPLPMGFSRQEYWSGFPFPSPMHESEKWKGSCSAVSNLLWPHGLQPTRLLCPWGFPGKSTAHGVFQARVLEWVAIAFSNMLSRLVITFLPRSKCLLISCCKNHLQWFWSPPK